MRKRTQSRELALQTLYQYDMRSEKENTYAENFLSENSQDKDVYTYARSLVLGCISHRDQIDTYINDIAQNWDISRMAAIDRNILRIATYEFIICQKTPPLVAINEAILLAKKFSTDQSSQFVNGVLDKLKTAHQGTSHV